MKKNIIFTLFLVIFLIAGLASCDKQCTHKNISETFRDATCTENGQSTYKCPDCGYSYISNIIEPKGHNYTAKTVAPTCTQDGYTQYECDCGHSYISDRISAKGHKYSDRTVPSSCTEGGYTDHKCSECGYSYISNQTDPKGHTFDDGFGIAPTCYEEGYTCYICSDCGYSYNAKYTAPLAHQYSTEITPPSCTEEGYTTYTCVNCSFSYKNDFTEPTGHSYEKEIMTLASCTQKGEEKYTCSCGDTYSLITSPTGHDFSNVVTMPTLSDMGYTDHSCKVCEYKYTGNYTFYGDILPDAYAKNNEVLAKGIDVSYHNYKVDGNGEYISLDWEAIKAAGINYVIIRIGDASIGIDPTFEKSYAEAKAAGLDVGFYFYTRAMSVNEIRLEAYFVESALKGKQFEYPVYLDLEDDSQKVIDASILNEMCVEFFTVLQRAGYYTGLYVNDDWLKTVIDTDSALSRFEIWYARFPTLLDGEEPMWNVDENGEHLGMWQYSDSGKIAGIEDMIFDLNFSYKDYPSIIKQYGFNGYESDLKFQDSNKSFVWVIYNGDIKIRSKFDYFITDEYDPNSDIVGYASKGTRFEVIEKNDKYTTVKYNGQIAYISANPIYISFEGIYFAE